MTRDRTATEGGGPSRVPVPARARDVLRLPYATASVGVARRWVRIQLAALGLGRALLDDVEVVVSELLGNAVRHARPIAGAILLLTWKVDDGASGRAVTVQVTDGGSFGAAQRCASDAGPGSGSGTSTGSRTGASLLAETGRGLRIVDGLASAWGVVDHPCGLCTVWATLAAGSAIRQRTEPRARAGSVHLTRRHRESG